MGENDKSSQSAWSILQEISKREKEEARKLYQKIKKLIIEYGDSIPKSIVLERLGFKSIDEMIDWELDWLPRKELNVKFQYKDDVINIIKDAFEDEELGIYEFF